MTPRNRRTLGLGLGLATIPTIYFGGENISWHRKYARDCSSTFKCHRIHAATRAQLWARQRQTKVGLWFMLLFVAKWVDGKSRLKYVDAHLCEPVAASCIIHCRCDEGIRRRVTLRNDITSRKYALRIEQTPPELHANSAERFLESSRRPIPYATCSLLGVFWHVQSATCGAFLAKPIPKWQSLSLSTHDTIRYEMLF